MATAQELLNDDTETAGTEAPAAPVETPAPESSQDSPEPSPKQVPLKALEDERQKRQSYEQLLAEQQRQNAALIDMLKSQQAPPPSPPAKMPDLLLEPDKWQQQLFDAVGRLLNEREQQGWIEKVNALEEDLRESTADYDDLVDRYFKPAAAQDPALQQQLRRAANPAKFAYRTAKRLKAEADLGGDLDVDKLRAKIEAEVKEKLLTELGQKQTELEAKVKLPASLGSEGSRAPGVADRTPVNGQWRARDLYE